MPAGRAVAGVFNTIENDFLHEIIAVRFFSNFDTQESSGDPLSCDGISPMGWDADRGWSRIRRVPGSIPGTAGSDCLSYCWEVFEEFGTCLGDISDDFRECFGFCFEHVWECCGDLLGPFGIGLGVF